MSSSISALSQDEIQPTPQLSSVPSSIRVANQQNGCGSDDNNGSGDNGVRLLDWGSLYKLAIATMGDEDDEEEMIAALNMYKNYKYMKN